MINFIKLAFIACSLLSISTLAMADDTSGSGKGFSSVVETTKIEGKSGYIVHNKVNDFWHYEKAPKGWPTAVLATCYQSLIFKSDSKAPIAINMMCESVDADGDANTWTATVDPKTGVGTGYMTAGTGKYANLTVKPTFQTIYQIDGGHSVYKFKW